MDQRTDAYIRKIDELLVRVDPVKSSWWSSKVGGGFEDTVGFESLYTEAISLFSSIYGTNNPHYERAIYFYQEGDIHALQQTEGLLIGTKGNLQSGLLEDLKSELLIDIKSDFLETARHLLEDGQKDPAAVLACIVLEDSIKRLVARHSVKGADNKEIGVAAGLLYKAGVIEKSTNQSIQNFKNLRNAALHAEWDQVSRESVGLLLAFLPMFIEKHGI